MNSSLSALDAAAVHISCQDYMQYQSHYYWQLYIYSYTSRENNNMQ